MGTRSKIEAFTLGEMLVVIIITSIVVGLAFSVLSLVQKQMAAINQNFEMTTTLNTLEQALWIDFDRYSKVTYDWENDLLVFTTELDTVQYRFTDTLTVRQTDTLNVGIQDKTFFFDGDSIQNGYVDAIKLQTTKTYLNRELFVFTDNDTTLYFD